MGGRFAMSISHPRWGADASSVFRAPPRLTGNESALVRHLDPRHLKIMMKKVEGSR
jgi:hypothetical protein